MRWLSDVALVILTIALLREQDRPVLNQITVAVMPLPVPPAPPCGGARIYDAPQPKEVTRESLWGFRELFDQLSQ